MPRIDISDVYSKLVNQSSEEARTQVVPNGKILNIYGFVGSSIGEPKIYVSIVWDYEGENEETLLTTSNYVNLRNLNIERTGDGVKKIAIVLTHNNVLIADPAALTGQLLAYYQ